MLAARSPRRDGGAAGAARPSPARRPCPAPSLGVRAPSAPSSPRSRPSPSPPRPNAVHGSPPSSAPPLPAPCPVGFPSPRPLLPLGPLSVRCRWARPRASPSSRTAVAASPPWGTFPRGPSGTRSGALVPASAGRGEPPARRPPARGARVPRTWTVPQRARPPRCGSASSGAAPVCAEGSGAFPPGRASHGAAALGATWRSSGYKVSRTWPLRGADTARTSPLPGTPPPRRPTPTLGRGAGLVQPPAFRTRP